MCSGCFWTGSNRKNVQGSIWICPSLHRIKIHCSLYNSSITLKILFIESLRNFPWHTYMASSLLTALVWGWHTLSKSSIPNFMGRSVFYKSFSIKLVIIKVFPLQPPKLQRIFENCKNWSWKQVSKHLRWKSRSALCLWKWIRGGHSFCTERNSSVSPGESQGSGFSQTSRGIA